MDNKIIWSEHSVSDLEYIHGYISQDSVRYANTVITRIIQSIKNLTQFPNSGRIVPEFRNQKIRELLVYNYRIIYQLSDSQIIILSIIHGKMSLRGQ